MTATLGLNCSGFHSSAALFLDGRLAHAICEERLTRVKQDKSFPVSAIRYCCDAAGIGLEDVRDVFLGWHPRYYLPRSDRTLNDALQNRGKLSYLALNELAALVGDPIDDVSQELVGGGGRLEIRFVDHHRAHAAGAFFQSGFPDADVLVLDGFGETTCGLAGRMSPDDVEVFRAHPTPHSLGLLYAAFTDFLGFKPYGDEWKVMALSALGDAERFYPFVRSLVRTNGLDCELDLSYFEFFLFFTPRFFSAKLCEALGEPTRAGSEPSQRDLDLVAALQRVVEETVFDLLGELHRRTGNERLVLGGGFFMNSFLNGKLHESTPYREIFLGGSPDDSGISLGAAFHGLNYVRGTKTAIEPRRHNCHGRSYRENEIRSELERRKIRFQPIDDVPSAVASQIRAGRIVGFFSGGSEFGQRALGARSILADPTRGDIKDLVNATVKYREGFRPFAPAVLAERQHEIFDDAGTQSSYFMERVLRFRPEWRERVPAVVHFDGTGRLQTVAADSSPALHAVLRKLDRQSGVPIVLNTSFNINGMPLVESPGDAIDCFYQSGLDTLVLESFLVEK